MDVEDVDGKMQVDGRPLRVLHIGNIANNAFNIAKLQREAGIEADVLCYDYYHIMGSPEWEDARFEGPIPDQYFPKWNKVNLNGYKRPEWFVQGDFASCVNYLIARNQRRPWRAAYYRMRMGLAQRQSWTVLLFNINAFFGRFTQPGYLAKKLERVMATPERASKRTTSWLCKKWPSLESVAPHIDLAMISIAMVLMSCFLVVSMVVLAPLVLLAGTFMVARKSWQVALRELREMHAPSRKMAGLGFAAWTNWLRLPFHAVTSLAKKLDKWLQIGWFQRFRGYALLALILMPVYVLATTVLALLAACLLIPAIPILIVDLCLRVVLRKLKPPGPPPMFPIRCQELMRRWSELFPHRPALTMNELIAYYESFDSFQQLLAHYDIVQGYATDPLWPLLCGNKPYVAYEHGTLREIPFQDNLIGKLTALAYRLSRHTFITNGDCRECAIRLGVPSLSPTLHGIDDRKFHRNQDLRNQLRRQYGVERLYLCPIRHDWAVKGTDQHIRALPNLVERTGKDFRLILIEWGEMVAQSKELAHSLGVEEQIIWIQPLPKRKLIDWIGAMDCVLDQLTLPHFGATAPEAMGCGIPVISSYDPESTRWIVEEPAPIQSAFTPEQVADRLMELSDPDHWKTVADKCLAWFQRNHSSQRLLRDHLDVYREILKFAESPMSKAA